MFLNLFKKDETPLVFSILGLDGFHVFVDDQECARNVSFGAGDELTVPCAATGSTLTIRLYGGDRVLTLCEVGVHGVAPSDAQVTDSCAFEPGLGALPPQFALPAAVRVAG